MEFEFSDAWLLQAIVYSEKEGKGAAIADIISFADYSNHAIITYSEFLQGTEKLANIGFLLYRNNILTTTANLAKWWDKNFEGSNKRSVSKELEEIQKKLNNDFAAVEVNRVKIAITESDFRKAVDAYLGPA